MSGKLPSATVLDQKFGGNLKMKSQNLLALLTLTLIVTACGKSMSLQVADGKSGSQNQTPAVNDVAKIAEKSTSLLKRVVFQIAPKEAVNEVLKMELYLNKAVIADAGKASICIIEKECRPLVIKDAKAESIVLDLREVFDLSKKSSAELMDWIYANTTEFGNPGYRKFRFTFEGISAIECGTMNIQVITNDKLPKDFATKPTCYTHGVADVQEYVAEDKDPLDTTTDACKASENTTVETIEAGTTKSLDTEEELADYSAFDMEDLKAVLTDIGAIAPSTETSTETNTETGTETNTDTSTEN